MGKGQNTTPLSEQEQTAKLAVAQEAKEKAALEKAASEAATEKNKKDTKSPYVKLAKEYAALYPEASEFHITTDMQVFLPSGLNNAKNHQRTLGKGEVTTIKVK